MVDVVTGVVVTTVVVLISAAVVVVSTGSSQLPLETARQQIKRRDLITSSISEPDVLNKWLSCDCPCLTVSDGVMITVTLHPPPSSLLSCNTRDFYFLKQFTVRAAR